MKEVMDQNYNAGQLRRLAELKKVRKQYKKDLILTLVIGLYIFITTVMLFV